MGQAGESFGIAVLRGLAGLRWLEEVEDSGDDRKESLDQIAVSFEPPSAIWPHDRAWRKEAGIRARRGALVASTLVKRPGRVPRAPTADELVFLARAATALVDAVESGALVPLGRRGDTFRTAQAGETGVAPVVSTRTWRAPPPAEIAPVDPPESLLGRRTGRATWIVGLRGLPAMIDEDDRVTSGLLVVDPSTGMLVACGIVAGADPADLGREFWRMLEGLPASVPLPSRMGFTSRSCLAAVGPGLRARRISAVHLPGHELLDEAFAGLCEMLRRGR